MELARTSMVLLQNLDRLPAPAFERQDLLGLAADPSTPDDLFRASVEALPLEAWTALDTAAGVGEADGRVGRLDLVAAASRGLDGRTAAAILLAHPELDTMAGLGAADGRFGREDLSAAVLREDGPADLAAASYYFASQPREYRWLENAAGLGMPDDGIVGWQDLRSAARHPIYMEI